MIDRLYIRNYAIIEELEIRFSRKLTIITGETGAGKSILLGALGLIMGNRADSKVLYNEEEKCVVEAWFEVSHYDLKGFFDREDLDYEDEVVIRRELSPSGKSRAFINDTPVKLQVLRELSSALVDVHEQFDTLDLHQVSFQVRSLDALSGNRELLGKYQKLYSNFLSNKRQLDKLLSQSAKADNEKDFLNFQLQEFRTANLIEGELEELEQEQQTLIHAEKIKQVLGKAAQSIREDDYSLLSQLAAINQEISALKNVHPSLNTAWERLESAMAELDDLSAELLNFAEKTEFDEERISEVGARLDLIYKLQNKHHVSTFEQLTDLQKDLENRVRGFEDLSDAIIDLEKILDKQEKELLQLADSLSKNRKKTVPPFEEEVKELLHQLAMPNAILKVDIDSNDSPGPTGIDQVNFLFASNKGSRLEQIKEVASGGELSRLTLVVKSLVASAIPLPTLVFDEIDSGISGEVALRMGDILHKLAGQHQVITITHTPQIAAKADKHYFVYKQEELNRTVTKVKELNKEERIVEIATMLSGNPPSKSAVENAQDLLGR